MKTQELYEMHEMHVAVEGTPRGKLQRVNQLPEYPIYVVPVEPLPVPGIDDLADDQSETDSMISAAAAQVDTWVVLVLNPTETHTFCITGGVREQVDGPYTRSHLINDANSLVWDAKRTKEWVPVGLLRWESIQHFRDIFFETEIGPNQYFVCRFLAACFEQGVGKFKKEVLRLLSGNAEYADREFEEGNNYYEIDQQHLNRWDGEVVHDADVQGVLNDM